MRKAEVAGSIPARSTSEPTGNGGFRLCGHHGSATPRGELREPGLPRSRPSGRCVMSSTDRPSGSREHVADERLGGRGVEVRRRLVEEQHRRVREERTGERRAAGADRRRAAVPSSPTRVSSPSGSESTHSSRRARRSASPELGVRCVRSRDAEVRADRRVEDVGVLAGERERRAARPPAGSRGRRGRRSSPGPPPGRGTAAAGS